MHYEVTLFAARIVIDDDQKADPSRYLKAKDTSQSQPRDQTD